MVARHGTSWLYHSVRSLRDITYTYICTSFQQSMDELTNKKGKGTLCTVVPV